jgi:hypothetical protein
MQNSSAFQYLAIDTIHESTTNPRRTFDEAKLQELADSIDSMASFSPSPSGLTTKDLRLLQEQGAIGLRCWPSSSQSRHVSSNSPMHNPLNGR